MTSSRASITVRVGARTLIALLAGAIVSPAATGTAQEGPVTPPFDAYERSVALVQRALERRPGDPELTLVLARVHSEASRFELAAEVYEAGSRSHPEDARFLAGLGETHLLRGQLELAVETLRRALALSPGGPTAVPAHRALADAYRRAGEFSRAAGELRAAAAASPNTPEIHFDLGQLLDIESRRLRSEGESERAAELALEARVSLETALRLRPEYADARYALGRLLIRLGERKLGEEQLGWFRRLTRKKKGVDQATLSVSDKLFEARIAVDVARILSELGEAGSALEHVARALEVLPAFEPAMVLRGSVYLRARRTPEAVRAFEEVLRLRPSAANFRNVAISLFEAGQLDECERVLRRGLARYAGDKDLLFGLELVEKARSE